MQATKKQHQVRQAVLSYTSGPYRMVYAFLRNIMVTQLRRECHYNRQGHSWMSNTLSAATGTDIMEARDIKWNGGKAAEMLQWNSERKTDFTSLQGGH